MVCIIFLYFGMCVYGLYAQYAASLQETVGIVCAGRTCLCDAGTAACVDEVEIACFRVNASDDAHVADAVGNFAAREEHQVAHLQVAAVGDFSFLVELAARNAFQFDVELVEYVFGEA